MECNIFLSLSFRRRHICRTNVKVCTGENWDLNPWWIRWRDCPPTIFQISCHHCRKVKRKVRINYPTLGFVTYIGTYAIVSAAISETEHSLTESLDSVSELPNTVGQQLQHLVKSRPRRTKTRAPTRPMLRPDQPIDGLALGEGLDVFFRPTTPTTPLISPTSDDR